MNIGTKVGLLLSVTGCVIGAYFGLSPVYSLLQSGAIYGQEAGLFFGITGIVIGSMIAVMAYLSSRKN
ncbi:hypothetical protein KO537_12690 [Shewanella sp. NKUCC01_JLK]|uniref:hypothetical protein n=1 Tax=Shewanella sp. NKUCC01_JLK TaxID=2842123 RepID=UPI001C5AFBBF|nr:hypothetical protein [Shewanella sp. NKUCC01_JLK]MBW3515576.1 hypothetical protein [Shewanella sp. NKUCC01_JLK]